MARTEKFGRGQFGEPRLEEWFPCGTGNDPWPKCLDSITFSVACQQEKILCAQLELNDKNQFLLWEDRASFAYQMLFQFDSGSWTRLNQGFSNLSDGSSVTSDNYFGYFMSHLLRNFCQQHRWVSGRRRFDPLTGPKHVTFLTLFVEDVTKNALSHCSFRNVCFNCFKLIPWTWGKISPSSTISWLIRATSYWKKYTGFWMDGS